MRIWNVDGMLAAMPVSVFREWQAAYDLDPWADEMAELSAASIVKMIHDVNVRPAQRKRPLSDFMIDLTPRTGPADYKSKAHQDKMKMIGAMIAGAHKAKE